MYSVSSSSIWSQKNIFPTVSWVSFCCTETKTWSQFISIAFDLWSGYFKFRAKIYFLDYSSHLLFFQALICRTKNLTSTFSCLVVVWTPWTWSVLGHYLLQSLGVLKCFFFNLDFYVNMINSACIVILIFYTNYCPHIWPWTDFFVLFDGQFLNTTRTCWWSYLQ